MKTYYIDLEKNANENENFPPLALSSNERAHCDTKRNDEHKENGIKSNSKLIENKSESFAGGNKIQNFEVPTLERENFFSRNNKSCTENQTYQEANLTQNNHEKGKPCNTIQIVDDLSICHKMSVAPKELVRKKATNNKAKKEKDMSFGKSKNNFKTKKEQYHSLTFHQNKDQNKTFNSIEKLPNNIQPNLKIKKVV